MSTGPDGPLVQPRVVISVNILSSLKDPSDLWMAKAANLNLPLSHLWDGPGREDTLGV